MVSCLGQREDSTKNKLEQLNIFLDILLTDTDTHTDKRTERNPAHSLYGRGLMSDLESDLSRSLKVTISNTLYGISHMPFSINAYTNRQSTQHELAVISTWKYFFRLSLTNGQNF